MSALRAELRLPRRYREFLQHADPLDVETVTPAERVRLIPAAELLKEQEGFALEEGKLISAPRPNGWRREWIIIGHSALLGDPYVLDVSEADAEGDCPVYAAMSGTDVWEPKVCAAGFATFLRILAVGLEVARDFSSSDYDDEFVFRETLGPKIRLHDPTAYKSGHWT